MLGFLLRRAFALAGVLVAVQAITSALLRGLRPEAYADPRALPVEVLGDVRHLLVLDLGRSIAIPNGPEVAQLLRDGLPRDFQLLFGALVLGALLGTAGGAISVARRGRWPARLVDALALVGLCAPVYWTALVLVRTLTPGVGPVSLGLFVGPDARYADLGDDPLGWLRGLAAPWLVLALPIAAMVVRMLRASLPEVMGEDWVRTARGKGLSSAAVMRRHAVPAASVPVVSLIGVQMATLVTNVVLVEQVFAVPGVFALTTDAVADGDFPVLQGIVLAGAVLIVAATALTDVVHARLDPRVRLGGGGAR